MEKSYELRMIEKDQRAIAPNIFIGLGGQGCKMVASLAKKAEEEKSPAKYLSFVAIDTDVNELRKIKAVSKKVVTVQTSSRMTIGEYLNYDENAKNNWFPINDIILDKTPSEGAGQVRAISNLVAHNAIREGEFTAIDDAIDSLFPLSDDNYEQSIHVTIIGTLAGGTGSGLVLPVALYVKNYLETARQQKSAVIRGFFILPDVMESVISSNVERRNQYSNAYASIREIDALMRRPYDKELQKRYPDLKVVVPKVGGNGYDEFNNAPFNFCFLFNKINNKGTSITEKDALLDHAVNCIYDMSISPICTKLNSQEDNIIREKISSGNKSSYAGAGCSELVYPYEEIVDYISLNWASSAMSNDWLFVDNELAKQRSENTKKQNEGTAVVMDVNENEEYITITESHASNEPFLKAIISQTQMQEQGSTDIRDMSDEFLTDLEAYITEIRAELSEASIADTYRQETISSRNNLDSLMSETSVNGDDIASKRSQVESAANKTLENAMLYHDATRRDAIIQSDMIANAIISADLDKNKNNNVPVIEKYMQIKSKENAFVHPNAARLFLLKASMVLQRSINDVEISIKKEEKAAKDAYDKVKNLFEASHSYDDLSRVENAKKQFGMNVSTDTIISTKSSEASEAVTALVGGMTDEGIAIRSIVDKYCDKLVEQVVYQRIKSYVDGMIEGFKELYTKIAGDIAGLEGKIAKVAKSIEEPENSPRRYACASKECLANLLDKCSNTIGAYDLPTELTMNIYLKAKQYAVKLRDGSLALEYGIKPGADSKTRNAGVNAFFGNVFDGVIMDFWRGAVEKNYGDYLDVDVVTASLREATFVELCSDNREAQLAYLKTKIEKARALATPFIDPPRGIQRRELRACTTSPDWESSLNEQESNYFKTECLDVFGLEASPDSDKHKILFFDAIYNIAAKNLVKMIPANDTSRASKDRFKGSGLYFATYHERVANIEPLDADNKEITPHIQKDWQYLNVLPEVDEEFQKSEEKRIAKAFIYALISGKIAYRKQDKNGYNYCYELVDSKIKSPKLIVSNGTNCDQFYEVLDALTICPRYVDRLLEMYEEEISFEKDQGNDFMTTSFAQEYIKDFCIEEFTTEKFLNIFFIPLLYKASAGSNYIKAWGEALVAAIFEMIDDIVARFENETTLNDTRCEFLISVFDDFYDGLDKLQELADGDKNSTNKRKHSRLKRIKTDSATLIIFDMVADLLENEDAKNVYGIQFTKKVAEIRDARRALSI